MTDDEVRDLILEVLAPKLAAMGTRADMLDGDTSLVELGLVDSLGFLELALEVENRSGRTLDLADADPDEFTTVAGFLRALRV